MVRITGTTYTPNEGANDNGIVLEEIYIPFKTAGYRVVKPVGAMPENYVVVSI